MLLVTFALLLLEHAAVNYTAPALFKLGRAKKMPGQGDLGTDTAGQVVLPKAAAGKDGSPRHNLDNTRAAAGRVTLPATLAQVSTQVTHPPALRDLDVAMRRAAAGKDGSPRHNLNNTRAAAGRVTLPATLAQVSTQVTRPPALRDLDRVMRRAAEVDGISRANYFSNSDPNPDVRYLVGAAGSPRRAPGIPGTLCGTPAVAPCWVADVGLAPVPANQAGLVAAVLEHCPKVLIDAIRTRQKLPDRPPSWDANCYTHDKKPYQPATEIMSIQRNSGFPAAILPMEFANVSKPKYQDKAAVKRFIKEW